MTLLLRRSWVLLVICLASGCPQTVPDQNRVPVVTSSMREACPQLNNDVLDGFLAGIDGLRDEGITRTDAVQLWVDGCTEIPPDGNFQGDLDACAACLTVLVEQVYAQP